jgi:hypothetical protein
MARRWLLIALLLIACCRDTYAQSIADARLPRAFVGAGIGTATSDADSRMRLNDGSALVWLLEGGARVSSRFGIGVELFQPSLLTGSTSGISFTSAGRQIERALVGLVRARVGASDRLAVDLVGGGGVLFQHHELRNGPCSGCAVTFQSDFDQRAPAFVVGVDVPVRAGRHFEVDPLVRYYALQRGDHTTELPTLVPWQFEFKSSARLAFGINGRARW